MWMWLIGLFTGAFLCAAGFLIYSIVRDAREVHEKRKRLKELADAMHKTDQAIMKKAIDNLTVDGLIFSALFKKEGK